MTGAVIDMGPALAEILARGEDAAAIQDQARQVGGFEQPIRLRGRIDMLDRQTGELEQRWSSEGMPDGVVHTRCNNRRASRCEPCSRLYQGDAWQLILAGLTGGKGVPRHRRGAPDAVRDADAPSFGPVHSRAMDASGQVALCRARRDETGDLCEHGRAKTCTKRHGEGDPELGRPLCVDCRDYAGAVLWNAHASELWRRTRIRISRELAALTGVSQRALKREVSVQYIKVAEYQKRGLVHFHLLIRLDAARSQREEPCQPPPEHYTAELLAQAVRNAVAHVEVPYPDRLLSAGQRPQAFPQGKWRQPPLTRADPTTLETRDPGTGSLTPQAPSPARRQRHPRRRVCSVGPPGRPARGPGGRASQDRRLPREVRHQTHRVRRWPRSAGQSRRPRHAPRVRARPPPGARGVAAGAARLHVADGPVGAPVRPRRYSTTFTALRAARAQWAASQRTTSRPVEGETVVKRWEVTRFGWRLSSDALLAQNVRAQARAQREAAREARAELNEVLALAG